MPWPLRMSVYAAIILLILLVYFGFRYFRSINRADLSHKGWFKSFYWVMVILFLLYPVWGWLEFRITGTFNRTGYPVIVLYLFWYGLACMGTMLNWLILHDILLPVSRYFSARPKVKLKKIFAKLFLTAAFLTIFGSAAKMIWDTHRITTEVINYTLPDTPDFEPLTIVHIADLHADPYTDDDKMDRYIQTVNSFNPDLVLFGGDLISSGTDYIASGAGALAKIESTYGVFAVLGDHDYWSGADYIIKELESRNIPVLHNRNHAFQHADKTVSISGITEIYSSKIHSDSLEALLLDASEAGLSIVSSHQASDRLIGQSLKTDMNILLGAHTHGGQIRIPIFFYPATAVREETPYVNGNWMLGNMLLNVNSGLGFTLSPVRYNAPAEVSVIYVSGQ